MLTPRDIETREFSRSRAGYKTDEVEAFLDEILADYSKLLEERESYAKRVLSLSEKLESLREEQQDELKKMLEANFKTRDEIIAEAKMQAARILNHAKSEQQNEIIKAEKELAIVQAELENAKLSKNALVKEVENFKSVLKSSYESHLKLINSLPSLTKEELEEKVFIKKPIEDDINTYVESETEPEEEEVEETVDIPEPEEDLSATIIMKPAKKEQLSDIKQMQMADEDEDLILSASTTREKPPAPFIRADEAKIKELFIADNKNKEKKPFKKQSRFFKQDNDDFFDDDFDDE